MIRITIKKLCIMSVLLLSFTSAQAITFAPFGSYGEGGSLNGQSLTVGANAEVFELDAYLNIAGQTLNPIFGTSAQLTYDPLPTGLDYSFSSALSSDSTDLTLSYLFSNNTGADIAGVNFFSYIDADIDAASSSSFNEYVTTNGALAAGQGFEADTAAGFYPEILDNLLLGSLDNTNAVTSSNPHDVAMALSFDLGTLLDGESQTIDIFISEDLDFIGDFSLIHSDNSSSTTLTYSGGIRNASATIPEPGTWVLTLLGIALMSFRFNKI